jgi:hypothetical protein
MATKDSCVLGIDKRNFILIKKSLLEKGFQDEFNKIEVVLRGNYLIK